MFMNTDLEGLIVLQRLDSAAHAAERRLAEESDCERALEVRLAAAREQVAAAKEQLAQNQNVRRAFEKDVALHQGRLSKFREQAMAVKTNQEYHAVQKEIEFAQTEMKSAEDKVLERIGGERATVIRSLSPQVLDTFERVAQRRNGIAVAEARGGICTICHVRLRPQVFNTVRRNEQIIQCDSCNRILYFVPAAEAPAADSLTQPAQ